MKGNKDSSLHEASSPLPLPCTFGRYRLVKQLATGGMAQIYLAKAFGAEGFVKHLVIKRLHPRLAADERFTSLFVNEAKLLVTLNHGNIVPVFDFGRLGADLYIAMEYIRGPSLRLLLSQLLERQPPLDPQLAAYITGEICKGLDYAHRKCDPSGRPMGIIHRDIKPTNILLSSEGEVKIVDFGVAKLAGRMESRGLLTGTLAYMSPEQAGRGVVSPRTDIFSAGLVLFEAAGGTRAYQGETVPRLLELARQAELPPIPEHIPRELQEIIRRATQKNPDERYVSAHEMEQALSEYLLLSRSAGTIVDSVSPASKLSQLMRQLELRNEVLPEDDAGSGEMDKLLPPPPLVAQTGDDPPDLGLLRDAAETFHSEFMTRVLREEEQQDGGGRRRWQLLALSGGFLLAALLIVGLLLLWQPNDAPPGATPLLVSASTGERQSAQLADPAAAATGQAEASAVGPAAPPAKQQEASKPRVRRRPRYGYLNLNSVPWSRVYIDGKLMSRPTPLLRVKLPVGGHSVLLVNQERGLRKRLRVQIRANEATSRVVQLQ